MEAETTATAGTSGHSLEETVRSLLLAVRDGLPGSALHDGHPNEAVTHGHRARDRAETGDDESPPRNVPDRVIGLAPLHR